MLFKVMTVGVAVAGILAMTEHQFDAASDSYVDSAAVGVITYGEVDPPPSDTPSETPTETATPTYTPTPGPTPTAQSAPSPRKRTKTGQRVPLSKTTAQGSVITWRSGPHRICVVKQGKVVTKRKGRCVVRGTAPATDTLMAYRAKYVIVVR